MAVVWEWIEFILRAAGSAAVLGFIVLLILAGLGALMCPRPRS
jgi:hypothetical protein